MQVKDIIPRIIDNVSKVTETSNPYNGAPAPVGSGPDRANTKTYTYDLVTQRPDGFVADRYQVVQNAVAQVQPGNGIAGPTASAGAPNRGIGLVFRLTLNNQGATTSSFQPATPVMLLPLPVIPGETFQSVGVDPIHGTTMVVNGTTLNRKRVDACGNVVDGWEVSANIAFSGTPATVNSPTVVTPQTAQYIAYFAPQLGAIPTYEKISPVDASTLPRTGTPADGQVPPLPATPASPVAAEASEISLAAFGDQVKSFPITIRTITGG